MDIDVVARNNVHVRGDGTQPMLFAHGFGCDQNMWRFVVPSFEPDYRVVLFDYVGSGGSDISAWDPERYASLEGYADDLLDVCRALDLKDVILVAHSVSAVVGVLAAIREPERFERIVMVGPSPRYIDDPPDYVGGFSREEIEELLDTMDRNFIGWANFLAPVVMANPDRPELTRELTESFCSTDPKIARRFAETTFFADNRADLPHLPVPALVLQCAEDAIAPRSVGEYVARSVPDGAFRLLDTTGHCPHMSAPDQTVAAIRDHLEGGG